MSKQNKSGNRKPTSEFVRAAAISPEDALAYQFLRAFGISLDDALIMVKKIISTKNEKVALFCFTAGVQIRQNVTFVGSDYANMRTDYPDLIISGERSSDDEYNFGILHLIGHILALAAGEGKGLKIRKKAGCCVTGEHMVDTDAGKINKEIAAGHAPGSVTVVKAYAAALAPLDVAFLNGVLEGTVAKSASMAARLSPSVVQPTVVTPSVPAKPGQ